MAYWHYSTLVTEISVFIIQIYVDWANMYLAQKEFPELINDLQKDINKGVILINLMESIGNVIS